MPLRYIFLIFLFFTHSYALSIESIRNWYKEGEYKKICSNGVGSIYPQFKDNEEFLNMYAHSCLEDDMINRMTIPILKLIRTPQTRANAVYYSTILYQKKLLYHALIDGIDISYISLPKTGHLLSIIFDKFIKKEYEQKDEALIFKDENKDVYHKLYLSKNDKNIYKLVLKTYKHGKIIKTRTYW